MKYRILGKTTVKVSVVGLGTWQLGGEWGRSYAQAEVDALFDKAREVGINLVDTAECYGEHLAERLIGRALAGDRDRWIVATKFGHEFQRCFERVRNYTPEAVVRQLEASLRALRTDYVDLYQFHSGPNECFDTPDLWPVLRRQVELGKVRHLGISIRDVSHLRQAERATDVGAAVVQVAYNRLDPSAGPILEACRRQNLGVLARQPLASGFLGGSYRPGATFPDNDVRQRWYSEGRDEMLERVARIREDEVPQGIPMDRWALSWCLHHPAVTSVIPGCKTIEQVARNASASELIP